ncbi:MAG: hypothetical protein DI536_35975 [Archangium gephyra]|uniref:Uncharacterized protein n=1 Tax=Archangium gephyra TaxID=48 RepID=A0A2W5SRM0_9BACT|nr:MAG: hypothetical protein DI536_35975 [Archangium gephyra]
MEAALTEAVGELAAETANRTNTAAIFGADELTTEEAARNARLLNNLRASRAGTASSRFGEYLDAVRARRNAEWMATPEAREGFAEYMTELVCPATITSPR